MAHYNQLNFVKVAANHIKSDWGNMKILEVGSYDVNGNIRALFQGSEYTGIDLCEGKGVDIVISGVDLALPDESFDLAISCESFEHNPTWYETFLNMYRMTKQGGALLFTCATTGRLEHGTQRTDKNDSPGTQDIGWDYYKNLKKSDFDAMDLNNLFTNYVFFTDDLSNDLYFLGIKNGDRMFNLSIDKLTAQLTSTNSIVKKVRKESLLYFIARKGYRGVEFLVQTLFPEKIYQNFMYYTYYKIVPKIISLLK